MSELEKLIKDHLAPLPDLILLAGAIEHQEALTEIIEGNDGYQITTTIMHGAPVFIAIDSIKNDEATQVALVRITDTEEGEPQ